MRTATEILQAYRRGELTLSQCWQELASIRVVPSKDGPIIQAPPSKIYLPLNRYEIKAIEILQKVSFGMDRSGKRFIDQISSKTELTARQKEFLQLLIYKYRRQIFRHDDQSMKARSFIRNMKGQDETS